MQRSHRSVVAALLATVLVAGSAGAADLLDSLKAGTPDLKSAGPLAFGPDGILFVGDTAGAAVFAIDTGDRTPMPAGPYKIENIDEKIAGMLGTDPKQLMFNDLAVNPASGRAYLSIARGRGPDATPVLLRIDREGKIDEVSLKNVKFAKAELPNAPSPDQKDRRGTPKRNSSITCLRYTDGKVIVAGLSNEEFASNLRSIPFPFKEASRGSSVEIYHGSHGQWETASPVRTFTTYSINGETNVLAAYTCTPLVKIPVTQLQPGSKVKGVTVAELGNMNNPLDIVIYQKDGKDYVLVSNDRRGVMKIRTDGIDKSEGITQRIRDKAGLQYDTIEQFKGTQQLAQLNKEQALVLRRTDSGSLNLESVALP
jgi:hypothetical protein